MHDNSTIVDYGMDVTISKLSYRKKNWLNELNSFQCCYVIKMKGMDINLDVLMVYFCSGVESSWKMHRVKDACSTTSGTNTTSVQTDGSFACQESKPFTCQVTCLNAFVVYKRPSHDFLMWQTSEKTYKVYLELHVLCTAFLFRTTTFSLPLSMDFKLMYHR